MGSIAAIVREQLLTQKRIALETKISELLATKVSNPKLAIIQLCLDPKLPEFKSLILREWLYLDMLTPISLSVCEEQQLQKQLVESDETMIITSAHFEKMLPPTSTVLERVTIPLDRWKGISNPERVRELVFLRTVRVDSPSFPFDRG